MTVLNEKLACCVDKLFCNIMVNPKRSSRRGSLKILQLLIFGGFLSAAFDFIALIALSSSFFQVPPPFSSPPSSRRHPHLESYEGLLRYPKSDLLQW